MSGAKRLAQAESKGKKQVTNADLKEKGVAKKDSKKK
jgi:hypothetical protein